jgi:hypothetical protein
MTDYKRPGRPTSGEIVIKEARVAREQQAAQMKTHVRVILFQLKSRATKASDEAA